MPFPICFDIDDTLVVGTGYRFRRAVLECSLIIVDALAPEPVSPTRLLQLQHEYDLALMPRYGFTRPRFCRSVVETYRSVVESRGRPADGDSLHHDVRAALAVGATAVWVRTPDLWAVFDAQLDPLTYHTIDELHELLPLLEAFDRP